MGKCGCRGRKPWDHDEEYAQGARCGNLEGKGRAGQYVVGEAQLASWEAARNQDLGCQDGAGRWAAGYERGYKLAAEGKPLPVALRLML